MSMATAAPDQSLCPEARDPKPAGGCRSCHGCHCHRPQFPSQQELQSPTSQDCCFFFFYFFHAVSQKLQLCGEGHQLYSWSQGHRWRAVQLQGPPHGCDGSPLAVLSASCLTLSILHKHSSADGPLLLKNLQRLSETTWMKSEVSCVIQGPRHSGSVNHLRSYPRFQQTRKPILSQTCPLLPSLRAFAHDISSFWSALPSSIPPAEIRIFPGKPVNRRRALAVGPDTKSANVIPSPRAHALPPIPLAPVFLDPGEHGRIIVVGLEGT